MRRLVLEKIKEILETKTTNGPNVFINRSEDADIEEFPLINVVSLSEQVEKFNDAPRDYKRSFLIDIECLVAGDDYKQTHNRLEDMIEAVEQLVESDDWLNNNRERETILNRISFEYNSDGDVPLASAILSYEHLRVESAQDFSKSDCIDCLNQVSIDWKVTVGDLDDQKEVVDAQDQIDGLNN